jgi:hypothetical protein
MIVAVTGATDTEIGAVARQGLAVEKHLLVAIAVARPAGMNRLLRALVVADVIFVGAIRPRISAKIVACSPSVSRRTAAV